MPPYMRLRTSVAPNGESIGGVWEELVVAAARVGFGHIERKHKIFGTVKLGRLKRIAEILYTLEYTQKGYEPRKPDWDAELRYVLAGKGGDIPVQVVCDVYVADTVNNKRYAFELKAPLPNSDITKVSKEKILKLYSMNPLQIDGAYFALPYNPYGVKENYSWSFPARWFDMKKDPVVLIGDEFWEKIGGLGTYQAFIAAVNESGREYKKRIYREFLGIEPPSDREDDGLEM